MIRLVHEFLAQSAALRPDQTALVCSGQRWSYAQVDAMANRLAQCLAAHGLQRGDRVALHLGNCLEMVVGIFGTLKAGGTFVGISPQVREARLKSILASCRPMGVVSQGLPAGICSSVPSIRLVVNCGADDAAVVDGGPVSVPFAQVMTDFPATARSCGSIDLDLACLIYTSGTTGEPKGVMCDHSNVVFVTEAVADYLQNREGDVILCVLPLAFGYGLYQLFPAFCRGATLVLENSFAYPALLLQRMQEERVSGFAGTPTIFALLLQYRVDRFELSHLRYLTNAAASLPVEHLRRVRQQFPQAAFYSMHGLTEVARTLYLPPELVDGKPTSVGIPIPGTEAWIQDEQGNRLGQGQTGELVIRGRNVMRGYWENPEATAARFRKGPLPGERVCHTGDLFQTDEDGHFYFVSRSDDIIKCRGEKVAPREVEDVLHQLEDVIEAAVLGVPDPILGQAIKAVLVVRDSGLTAATVLAHCRRHLEDFMVPKHVEFRDELPRTPSGKVTRAALA